MLYAEATAAKAKLANILQPLWDEECARAVKYAEYPDLHTDLATVRETLMSLCASVISQLVDAQNLLSPVSKLPDSLQAAIFALVPTRERAAVGSVCRTWNRVMYSHPAIWSYIDHDGRYGTGEYLERVLSFSKEASLYLNLRLSVGHCEKYSYALGKHIRRCVTLRLALSRALNEQNVEAVATALAKPAPLLRELRFFDNSCVYKAKFPWFMGAAPSLELVKMECDITALCSSTSTFAQVKGVLYSPPSGLSVDDLIQLVRLFPAAEELAVDFNHSDGSFDEQALQPIRLPSSIRSFFVVAHKRTADASRVLRAVQAERVQDVCVPHGPDAVNSVFNQVALDTTYNLAAPGPVQDPRPRTFIARAMSLATTMLTEESMSIVMHETEENIFEPLPVPRGTTGWQDTRQPGVRRSTWDIGNRVVLEPAMFMQLRRLELTEVAFDPDMIASPIPPLPVLLHLTILFLRHISHARKGRVCGFVWAAIAPSETEHQARTLVCPRLQTLRFGSIESRNPHVEPSAITAFVKRHLRYDAEKLAEMLFYGTDLFVTDPGHFEEMLQLARTTEWDTRYLGPAYRKTDIVNWW